MNKIENMIKYIISTYSTAFPTRWLVLHHMFFVTGNGMHWSKSGELIGRISYDAEKPIDLKFDQLDSLVVMQKQLAGIQIPDVNLSLDVKIDFYTRMSEFTRKNIDTISANNFYYFDEQKPSIEQFGWGFCGNHLLTDLPKNIQSGYKSLVFEAVSIAMNVLIEKSYKNNQKINSFDSDFMLQSNWINTEHMDNYLQLKSIIEKLI